MRNPNRQSGFSTVDVLIAAVLLVLLAGMAVPSLKGRFVEVRDQRRVQDLELLSEALVAYHADHGSFPSIEEMGGADACGWANSTRPDFAGVLVEQDYLSAAPRDPINVQGEECHAPGVYAYKYYLYAPGSYSADPERGAYFVVVAESLEARRMGAQWATPGRDWGSDLGRDGYAIGAFANP